MKFGHNIHRYHVVEWTQSYIDYRALKRLYKLTAKLAADKGERAGFTAFKAALKQNVTKAESFYETRYAILRQRSDTLHSHYGISKSDTLDGAAGLELQDIILAFLEFHDEFKKLQWYEFVNFNKILGRLEKFQGGDPGAFEPISLAVTDAHATTRTKCLNDLQYVHDRLQTLQSRALKAQTNSEDSSWLQLKGLDGLFPIGIRNINAAITRDDPSRLGPILNQSFKDRETGERNQQRLALFVVQLLILRASPKCLERLIPRIRSSQDLGDHVHWLVIKLGRRQTLCNRRIPGSKNHGAKTRTVDVSKAIDQLVRFMRRLGPMLTVALNRQDCFGRLPLHHAVHYGLFEVTQVILEFMNGHKATQSHESLSSALMIDSEGSTALDIAVLHRDTVITRLLIEDSRHGPAGKALAKLPGKLLLTALKLDSSAIIKLLISSSVEIDHKDYNDETALYLAARSGRSELVTMVLEASDGLAETLLDVRESVCGWTPLILACINGDLPIMNLLIRYGANPVIQDLFGWTAKDHAAFRGYLPMAKALTGVGSESTREGSQTVGLDHKGRRIRKACQPASTPRYSDQDLSSGHSQVFVNLGALDTYKPITAVNMSRFVSPDTFDSQREADFQVEIRAVDEDQSSQIVQLPILEDMANKPWRFTTNNPREFKLAFNIFDFPSASHGTGTLIGSAVALLENLKQGLGGQRESLIRDFTIPILEKESLDCIGTLTFYFLIMTPFPHPRPLPAAPQAWQSKRHDRPTIIGHRGIGQNDPSRRQLQIGENTVESFLSAIGLGASYIELTKDNVPIIYHDFLMSETGIDAPLHSLSLEQFMYISEAQSSLDDLSSMAEKRYLERCGDRNGLGFKQRSHSLSDYEQSRARSLVERMKHTFEYKLNESKGYDSYKGNIRSECIQASFMTLEEMFVKLPESVRFDIEIKYPMLFEAHDWGMDTYAIELNLLVDTVLDKVYRLAGSRTVFLSSFSPEMCILLSNKQQNYPVYFLTESGHIPSADARADSLQEAIHFARSWHLPGIIARSQPLVMCPDLIRYVQDSGLECISWGELNDDPENAEIQASAGLEAIIVNSVNLIVRTLAQN